MMKSQIEVIVRIRPLLQNEKEKNTTSNLLSFKNDKK